jgi:hypothetical protein
MKRVAYVDDRGALGTFVSIKYAKQVYNHIARHGAYIMYYYVVYLTISNMPSCFQELYILCVSSAV